MVPITKLVPNPKNPNVHTADQIERIAQIIEFQGWRRPITVSNQSGFMTVGHGRLEAAKLRGWREVPVSYQDYENAAAEYADMVADNALAEWADLDRARINTDIIEFGPDFDLDLLGINNFTVDFSEHELDDKPEKDAAAGAHTLIVTLPTEEDMVEVYNDLLSRGFIVKYG